MLRVEPYYSFQNMIAVVVNESHFLQGTFEVVRTQDDGGRGHIRNTC